MGVHGIGGVASPGAAGADGISAARQCRAAHDCVCFGEWVGVGGVDCVDGASPTEPERLNDLEKLSSK